MGPLIQKTVTLSAIPNSVSDLRVRVFVTIILVCWTKQRLCFCSKSLWKPQSLFLHGLGFLFCFTDKVLAPRVLQWLRYSGKSLGYDSSFCLWSAAPALDKSCRIPELLLLSSTKWGLTVNNFPRYLPGTWIYLVILNLKTVLFKNLLHLACVSGWPVETCWLVNFTNRIPSPKQGVLGIGQWAETVF